MSELDHIVMDAKLKRHDKLSRAAVDYLIHWLQEYPDELIAIAKGRHVTGHLLYGDRNYAEWDLDRLAKETAEELADGINYTVEVLSRQQYGVRPE